MATTCKRDAEIQKIARKISKEHKEKQLFSVIIDSWDEIKELLDKYPKVHRKYYLTPRTTKEEQIHSTKNLLSLIKITKNENYHDELNRIRDHLMNKYKPQTAFTHLEKFKQDLWNQLDDKVKCRILSYKGISKISMKQNDEGADFLIQALQFNKGDEEVNTNCAVAFFLKRNIEESKKYIQIVKHLNPTNKQVCNLEIQIKNEEGVSITEIVNSLSKTQRTNKEIAFTLAQINLEKTQYTEAYNYLQTAYDHIDHNSVDDISSYANLMSEWILSKEDICIERHIPDDLKNEAKKIINIYQKLIQNNDYLEVQKFNPQWYLYYAVIYYFNEQNLDKAIKIIQQGLNTCEDKYDLQVRLSQFLIDEGREQESIHLLESIENAKEPYRVKLLLSEIYFRVNEKNKATHILNEVIHDNSIDKSLKLDAQKFLVSNLIRLKDFNHAEQELDTFFENNKQNIFTLILKSKIENHKKNKEQQISYLNKAHTIFLTTKDQVSILDQRKLIDELYFSQMYQKCEPLLEKITNQNVKHSLISKLLDTYFKNGKNDKAIELAEKLHEKFPHKEYPVNFLSYIHEYLGNREKSIQCYEQFIKLNPNNISMKIKLSQAYIQNEQLTETKKLLTSTQFDRDQLSVEQINILAYCYIRVGRTQEALEMQYQSIQDRPDKMELQSAYFYNITVNSQSSDFLNPKKIELDCWVKLASENTDKDIIIEKNSKKYHPDLSPLVKHILGRKKGEYFNYNDKKYRIIDIKSKYIAKRQEIGKHSELQFGSQTFIKHFSILKKTPLKDLEKIQKKLQPNITEIQQQMDKILQYYMDGMLSIGFISQILKKHPIHTIFFLIHENKVKFISNLSGKPQNEKLLQHLHKCSDIIIDLSSLINLHLIKLEQHVLHSDFDLYVCQSTIDSLNHWIQDMTPHSKHGLMQTFFDKENKFSAMHTSPDNVQEHINFCINIVEWVKKYCKIKTIPATHIMSLKEKLEQEKIVGKVFLDPVLSSHNAKNTLFLTEDDVLDRYFQNGIINIHRIRIFDIIEFLKTKAIIENKQAIQFKAELIKFNQTYIPIDHTVLLLLLKQSNYSSEHEYFQKGLFFLGPVSNLQGVIGVTSNFLIDLFQESSLSSFSKDIITKTVLNKLSEGRNENPEYIASKLIHLINIKLRLSPFHHREVRNSIVQWLRYKIY